MAIKYEEMKVEELRKCLRGVYGHPLQKNGHKFNKPELIEILRELDGSGSPEETEEAKEAEKKAEGKKESRKTAVKWIEPDADAKQKAKDARLAKEQREREKKIPFATNFVQIVQKYSGEKPSYIYKKLRPGDIIVFVHAVHAKDGNTYNKIRTSKIVSIDHEKRTVSTEMIFGGKIDVPFEEIMHIRKQNGFLPADIRKYLRYKRTCFGDMMVKERFSGNERKN